MKVGSKRGIFLENFGFLWKKMRFFGVSEVVKKDAVLNHVNEPVLDRADVTLIIGLDIVDSL